MRIALVLAALWLALPCILHAQDAPVDLRSVEEAMELARQHMREDAVRRTAHQKPAHVAHKAKAAHAAPPPPRAELRPGPFSNDAADAAAAMARLQLEDARAGR
jgi:hypothetical protein